MIKFNKHHVTDGAVTVRCFYSLDNRVDQRKCVTMYAKDYSNKFNLLFPAQYVNDTDSQSDIFDEGRVVLFEDHELYSAARARAESNKALK